MPASTSIPVGAAIRRVLLLRCPRCGARGLFRRFRIQGACPSCGLRVERERGHWTGDLGINVVLSFGALLLTLIGWALFTWPELPVVPALASALAAAIVLPVVFYPLSKSAWFALDYHLHRERDEVS